MRDFELLCEIEDLQNRVSRLETEKMDIMLENGKNKKKLYAKKDKIKKQNIKLKNLQSQLDQQKAMWNELKEHISNQIIHYDELSDKFKEENNNGCVLLANSKRSMIEEILYKMQELEGEKDVKG